METGTGLSSLGNPSTHAGDITPGFDIENVDNSQKDNVSRISVTPILDGESVKVSELSDMERLVMEGTYESAMETAKNLVDSPEERKKKELRARERSQERELKFEIDQEKLDADIMTRQMADEIQTKREEKV